MDAKPQLDPFGALAYILYAGIGGVLVYGFAAALSPAVERQNSSVCKPMVPKVLEGAAPSFTVQDLDGNEVTLEDFRGKFLVINFWATWCEPCLSEWPQVHQLAERLGDREDVVILAISLDQDPNLIAPYLERMALSDTRVRVLWDPEQKIEKEYGTEKLPDTYFVDENGQLLHAYINARKWGAPGSVQCVESMVGRRS